MSCCGSCCLQVLAEQLGGGNDEMMSSDHVVPGGELSSWLTLYETVALRIDNTFKQLLQFQKDKSIETILHLVLISFFNRLNVLYADYVRLLDWLNKFELKIFLLN